MKLFFTTLVAIFLLSNNLSAQKNISGKVFDDQSKMPLAGVTVTPNKGTAVTTDSTGFFQLSPTWNLSTLSFSSIGYFPLELNVKSFKNGTVYLKPNAVMIDEVTVSTGYQQLPKERSTGSFDKIDNQLLNRSTGSDVLSRLEGVSSSLYFSKVNGDPPLLFIRGLSSLQYNTATSPLIILNNFPYSGDIRNINPNDVESVTLLKDAAAASIWGAQAGNGVIVITTKKANYKQPVSLSFTSTFITQDKPALYKDRNYMRSSDFIDVEKFLFTKGFYDDYLSNIYYYPAVSPVVEILSKERDGTLSSSDADAQINALSKNDIRQDYLKYLYRKASTQQYSLSLSGGSENVNYLLNAGFDKNQLAIVKDGNRRNTFNANINIKPVKRLDVSSSFFYTDTKSVNDGIGSVAPGLDKANIYPYARLVDDAGNPVALIRDHRMGYIDTVGNGLLKDWNYYPLQEINDQDISTREQDVLLDLGLKYSFNNQFSVQLKGQYENMHTENRNLYNSDSYYARNYINLFTNIIDSIPVLHVPDGGILDNNYTDLESYNIRGQANYDATFNGVHNVSVIAGAEARQNSTESHGDRVYGYNDNILTSSNVDYVTEFNLYGYLGSSTIDNPASFSEILDRYLSLYANGAYSFKNKYTVTASVRKDASNLFGVNANQKWNPFWSSGIAWKLSDEPFYKLAWLPFLKARVTYGFSGNINNGLSALAIIHYSSTSRVTGLPYAFPTQPPNPDLTWERTGTLNWGLDFATFKNKLSGSIEYYIKKSADLFIPVHIDPTIGAPGNLLTMNAGNLSTKGIDVKLNSLLEFNKIKWEGQLLFSYVRNKVTNYKFDYADKSAYISTGNLISPLEGQDPYALICYKWGGLDPQTGDPQGYIDGKISKDYYNLIHPTSMNDLVIKGTARPPYFGSFINSFYYKGFGISANIIFKWGYYFMRSGIQYDGLFNYWAMNTEFTDRWQKPGDEKLTNVPSMTYPSNYYRDQFYIHSEALVEKGDNVRLQDIRLSYDFNFSSFQSKVVEGLQLFVYANNVGIIWRANDKGIDPDYGFGIPAPHNYSFGLKANF
jgi:TonB-dependent starch-binding outer membrane protein SusC